MSHKRSEMQFHPQTSAVQIKAGGQRAAGKVSGKLYVNAVKIYFPLGWGWGGGCITTDERSRLVEGDQTGTGADQSLAGCFGKPHKCV